MCDCRTKIDESLKGRNAKLASGFILSSGKLDLSPPIIQVEKINPRGKKPPVLVATCCPFCGEKFANGGRG